MVTTTEGRLRRDLRTLTGPHFHLDFFHFFLPIRYRLSWLLLHFFKFLFNSPSLGGERCRFVLHVRVSRFSGFFSRSFFRHAPKRTSCFSGSFQIMYVPLQLFLDASFIIWRFQALSTSLPTCLGLNIIAKPFDVNTNATNGTPPFYMISLAVGGTPQTSFIGTDENNLLWTVTHAPGELFPNVASRFTLNASNVGTRLILQVVDANGSAGGIPPRIFDVIGECWYPTFTTVLAERG